MAVSHLRNTPITGKSYTTPVDATRENGGSGLISSSIMAAALPVVPLRRWPCAGGIVLLPWRRRRVAGHRLIGRALDDVDRLVRTLEPFPSTHELPPETPWVADTQCLPLDHSACRPHCNRKPV